MREYENLVGKRYGRLVVIKQEEPSSTGRHRWLCQCDCGCRRIVFGTNLKRGTTSSCGCKKCNNLTGQHIGRLTVLERSDKYGKRGKRKTKLWKCRCDCGAITYKATDTLTNKAVSMCSRCAELYALDKAREQAGFVGGTQLSRIRDIKPQSCNFSGFRGVYYDNKSNKYRARIRFRGKLYSLGSYEKIEDAIKARRLGEEQYFGKFIESLELSE